MISGAAKQSAGNVQFCKLFYRGKFREACSSLFQKKIVLQGVLRIDTLEAFFQAQLRGWQSPQSLTSCAEMIWKGTVLMSSEIGVH